MPSRHSATEHFRCKEIMNLLTNRFTILTGALSAVVASTASGNIVTNGDFAAAFDGWTLWGGAASQPSRAYISNTDMFSSGPPRATFMLNDLGGMYQDVTTTAGELYTVSFALRQVAFSQVPRNIFELTFGSQVVLSLVDVPTIDPIRQYSFEMVADSSITRLKFSCAASPFATEIATVVVAPVAVPAPGAIALVGLAGLAGGRRRRA